MSTVRPHPLNGATPANQYSLPNQNNELKFSITHACSLHHLCCLHLNDCTECVTLKIIFGCNGLNFLSALSPSPPFLPPPVQFGCCGVNSPEDFEESLFRLINPNHVAPEACCQRNGLHGDVAYISWEDCLMGDMLFRNNKVIFPPKINSLLMSFPSQNKLTDNGQKLSVNPVFTGPVFTAEYNLYQLIVVLLTPTMVPGSAAHLCTASHHPRVLWV